MGMNPLALASSLLGLTATFMQGLDARAERLDRQAQRDGGREAPTAVSPPAAAPGSSTAPSAPAPTASAEAPVTDSMTEPIVV